DPPPTLGPGPRWDGATEVDFTTGTVTAPGFNDLIDAEAPEWATDPLGTVTALLHLDRTDARIKTGLADGAGDPVVTVVLSGLGDDSIAAIRYRIVLTQGDDGRFRFAAGEAAWRCQPGRGPVEFGTRSCVGARWARVSRWRPTSGAAAGAGPPAPHRSAELAPPLPQ